MALGFEKSISSNRVMKRVKCQQRKVLAGNASEMPALKAGKNFPKMWGS
jgi:hypothetical protein